MSHANASADTCAEEEYVMPSLDALIAGTLALMTGYAQADQQGPHRSLISRKVVSNLFFLAEHPQVSPAMRCMLTNLRSRWQLEAEQAAIPPLAQTAPTPLWHATHEVLQ